MKCKNGMEHEWEDIEEGVKWCPVCNTVLCIPEGNRYRHPGLFVTAANNRSDRKRGRLIVFRKPKQKS